MNIIAQTKICIHCHRSYTYNPSTGDLGTVCKHCKKPQAIPATVFKPKYKQIKIFQL